MKNTIGFMLILFMVLCSIFLFIRCDVVMAVSITFLFVYLLFTCINISKINIRLEAIDIYITALEAEMKAKKLEKIAKTVKPISNSIN